MAYIKTLKDNELIGGTDQTDVYPITSTQAIYSQSPDGTIPEGVSHPKLEDRLQDMELEIASVGPGGGGIALKQDFGNSEIFGISQRVLTESRDDLQAQIDAIVSDKATINLTVSPSVSIVGTADLTLEATTNTNAESIVIKQGTTVIASGSGKSLKPEAVTVQQSTAGSIAYTAEFTFAGGNKKSTNVTVYFVNEIYVGSGAVYTDVTTDTYAVSARRNVAGTYNVTVAQNEQYIFFVIPATMSITKATLNGFKFPLDAPVSVTVESGTGESVAYKSYRSSNTNDAGTYQIVVS